MYNKVLTCIRVAYTPSTQLTKRKTKLTPYIHLLLKIYVDTGVCLLIINVRSLIKSLSSQPSHIPLNSLIYLILNI